MRGVPVNQKTRDDILRLHSEGVERNEIARRLDVSTGVVSRVVKAAGGTFKRAAATKEATEARAADWASMRDEVLRAMHVVALQEAKRASSPYVVFAFGGVDNSYSEHTLDLPPAAEVRNMQTTAALFVDKSTQLIKSIPEGGTAEAESVLDRIEAEFDGEFDGVDDTEFELPQ